MTDQSSPDDTAPHETTPQETRSIDVEIEVPGTPEEVWRAIATGPGVSSWYVPHTIDERAGGDVTVSFGPGMEVTGRVAAWEPPHRFVIDNGDDVGLAFEWLVEARDGASCVVRLVNSGFGSGEDWDAQYDGMREGWQIFLANLRLHLEHHPGGSATAMLPMATWAGPRDDAWTRVLSELGLATELAPGDRFEVTAGDAPELAGTVADAAPHHLSLLLDRPAAGTAFVAAEGHRDEVSVSIWSYLYGDDAPSIAERDEPRWRDWLAARGRNIG